MLNEYFFQVALKCESHHPIDTLVFSWERWRERKKERWRESCLPFFIFLVVNLAARMRWSRAVCQWLVAHDPCPPGFRSRDPAGFMNERNPCQQDPVACSFWPGFRSPPLWIRFRIHDSEILTNSKLILGRVPNADFIDTMITSICN